LQEAQNCYAKGLELFGKADFSESLHQLQTALAILELHMGKENQATGETTFWLALVYWSLEDYPQSLNCLRRTFRIRALIWHPESRLSCGVLNEWLAEVLDASSSRVCSRLEIHTYQRSLWISINYEIVGEEFFKWGSYPKAHDAFKTAQTLESTFTSQYSSDGIQQQEGASLDEADLLCKMAQCSVHLKLYSRARKEYSRAHAIYNKRLGKTHRWTLETGNNLGGHHRHSRSARSEISMDNLDISIITI
jgi:tetratricopeptide (TPR) repeat protein